MRRSPDSASATQRSRAAPAWPTTPPAALARLRPGDVLVARSTTPAFNSALSIAGGLVVEEGGYLSHAAVTARELGLPAVIGAAGALSALPDGELVCVEPDLGIVRRLHRGAGTRHHVARRRHGGPAHGLPTRLRDAEVVPEACQTAEPLGRTHQPHAAPVLVVAHVVAVADQPIAAATRLTRQMSGVRLPPRPRGRPRRRYARQERRSLITGQTKLLTTPMSVAAPAFNAAATSSSLLKPPLWSVSNLATAAS